jgi:hypothetical protein
MNPLLLPFFVLLLLASACDAPEDRIFVPETVMPEEVRSGLFRLTWNEGPDVVRGITPDGARIVYHSEGGGIGGFQGARILSIAIEGGAAREEAGLYRAALLQPVANLVYHEAHRMMSIWVTGVSGTHSCVDCPAPPRAVGIRYLLLPAGDTEPLSSLPSFQRQVPAWGSAAPGRYLVRVTPTESQIRGFGIDPYRPALTPGGLTTYFSDGEAVWRFDAATGGPPDSIFPGAFVALSPDGTRLAVSAPVGVDSTSGQCFSGLDCQQTTWMMTLTNWLTTIYDITSLAIVVGPFAGFEPAFAPDGSRVLVRRFGGLFWVDLASGAETFIEGTEGAFAPAVFPDGSGIAFSARLFGNADVFFMR